MFLCDRYQLNSKNDAFHLLDIFPKNVPPSRVVGTLLHRLLLGPNILMTNGEEWKMHRKVELRVTAAWLPHGFAAQGLT